MSALPLPDRRFEPWLGLPGVTAGPIGDDLPGAALTAPAPAAELARRNAAAGQLVVAITVGLAGALVLLAMKRRR